MLSSRRYRIGEEIRPDYIPTEPSAPVTLRSQSGTRTSAPPSESLKRNWEVAGQRLAALSPATVLDLLQTVSPFEQSLYLLAEEKGQNRVEILSRFPKPSPTLRKQVNAMLRPRRRRTTEE